MNKKMVEATLLECPNCGQVFGSLIGNSKGLFPCRSCGKTFPFKEWKQVKRKVWAYRCPSCEGYVENTSENWNMLGIFRHEVMCPRCNLGGRGHLHSALVAINGVHVSALRKPTASMFQRSRELDGGLYVLFVERFRDRATVRVLNYEVQLEESGFRSMPKKDVNCYLLFSENKSLGYLAWNKSGGKPAMRQLYVVKDERRQGYATKLVEHFIEENCDISQKVMFLMESPNYASIQLFSKLGFIKIEDGKAVGVRTRFIGSC